MRFNTLIVKRHVDGHFGFQVTGGGDASTLAMIDNVADVNVIMSTDGPLLPVLLSII